MILKKLQLQNFKGIKEFTLDAQGCSCSVYGTNASGKTSVADALSWLLFDKAYTDEVGFSPKPKDASGKEIHYLDTSVEAEFVDGTEFKKVLSEVWTKKRGSSEAVYSGNTIQYFVESVPVPKKAYDAAVDMMCPSRLVQVLSKPSFFPDTMPWQKRRELLLEVCGSVSDADVLQSMPELGEMIGTHTVDDFRTICKAQLKRINQRLGEIPVRIDEAMKSVSDEVDHSEYWSIMVKQAKEKLEDLTKRKLIADAGSDSEIKAREIESMLKIHRMQHEEAERSIFAQESAALQALKKDREDLERKLTFMESVELSGASEFFDKMCKDREFQTAEYKRIASSRYEGSGVCPTCGQELPAEMLENAIAKFNEERAKALVTIREYVEKHCSKEMISAAGAKVSKIKADIEIARTELVKIDERIANAPRIRTAHIPFEETDEYKSLTDQLKGLKRDPVDDGELTKQIVLEEHKVAEYSAKIAAEEASKAARARVDSLKAEMEDLQVEYDRCAAGVDLCDKFVREKVKMLDESINAHFDSVKFKLFQEQINGGMTECCDVLVPGEGSCVEYKSANNAAKINAGLEIIQTISNHFNVSLPVFVDNAESVVSLKKITSQVIRLVVSESDPTLRVEINGGI